MQTYFYTFENEQEYIDLISVTDFSIDDEGNQVEISKQVPPSNVDVIGLIYENVGTEEEPDMQPVTGWHVNSPTPVEGWESKQVFPTTPARVFWGTK